MENQITRDYSLEQEEATAFFNAQASENSLLKAAAGNDFYTDKDGLVQIICGYKQQNDPAVDAKLAELQSTLLALTSIVVAYVKKYWESRGSQNKIDINLWQMVASKLPLMNPEGVKGQTYNKDQKGIEIPANLANIILEVTNGNADSMNRFGSFLQNEGNYLRTGIDQNRDSYPTITIANSIEVIKVGNEVNYIPKIKFYKANFDRNNAKWSSACASNESVAMNFGYECGNNIFDYKALNSPNTKRAFDDFINKMQREPVEYSPTFFNDRF